MRRVFENAQDNSRLEPFDVHILQTLFMIRYVKEVRGTVENLTTLSLSDIAQDRLATLLERHIEQSDVFVKGSKLTLRASSAVDVLTKGLEALITATYSKLGHVKSPFESDGEVERTLRKGGEAQTFEDEPPNALAHAAVHAWLSERDRFHQRVSLRALLNHFGGAPYGWTDLDVVGVLAELVASGKVEISHPSGVDTRRSGLVKDMRSKNGSESYTLRVPKVVDERALRLARELAKDTFNLASVSHDAGRIVGLYKDKLGERAERLRDLSGEANRGNYPFKGMIEAQLETVKSLLSADSVAAFFDTLNARADDFEEMSESFDVIDDFYRNQRPKFDEATRELSQLSASLRYLEPEMRRNAEEVERILNADDPTRDIRKLSDLLASVKAQLETRKETAKEEALERWQSAIAQARALGEGKLDVDALAALLEPLETLRTDIERAPTIDAVLASKSRLSDLGGEVKGRIVAQINAQAEKTSGDDSVKSVTGTQNKARPIVTLKLTRLADKPVLSSGADVNTFLETLRQTLEQALQEGQDIHLE